MRDFYTIEKVGHDYEVRHYTSHKTYYVVQKFNEISNDYAYTSAMELKQQLERK